MIKNVKIAMRIVPDKKMSITLFSFILFHDFGIRNMSAIHTVYVMNEVRSTSNKYGLYSLFYKINNVMIC